MAKLNLQTPTARKRLEPRGKPYAARLLPGVWIAYRAAQSGTGTWIVIAADGKGGRWQKVIAHADDQQESDGQKVLSYEQAANRCRAQARGDANAAAGRPATISDAITSYETDLTGRGRLAYNAKWVRLHLPPHLALQPLALVTAKQLRDWRDALLKGGMLPPTLNRMLKGATAAFNLQSRLDPRIAANAQAWKVGLEALPGTVTAREAVLTDQQVLRVVAAAYDESPAFGLYVQVHAEVGSRSSQLARLTVGDLQPGRLMVPSSRKGRGRKADKTPVPLTPGLQAKLKAAAAGRAASTALLLRADGAPWKPKIADHRDPFARAARAAKLPVGTTIYALRHSSIVRALLKNLPLKVVSDWHDTSTSQIEAHYGRFLKHHYSDLVKAALIDFTPAESANVVPLRA